MHTLLPYTTLVRSRSSTGRLAASSLRTLRKPFGSATAGLHDRGIHVSPFGLRHPGGAQHPLVVGRHDLGELRAARSEEHTSELQSLMRISYAVFCLKKKKQDEKEIRNETMIY